MGGHDGGPEYSPVGYDERSNVAYNAVTRYRYIAGCAITLALVVSIAQLLLTIDVRAHLTGQPQSRLVDGSGWDADLLASEFPCGITAEEARKAGCLFDLGLVAWLPPACYNRELDERFRAANSWNHWLPNDDNTGPNLTKPITTEKHLQELPVQMVDEGWPGHSWSTMHNHDAHCMHTWEYLHQALLKGRRFPSLIVRFEHTAHCTCAALLDTSNLTYQETSPRAHGRYPACLEIESLRGEMPEWY